MTDLVEPAAALPRAGWYQDPTTIDSVRWWSGAAWTDHVRPTSLVMPPSTPLVSEQSPAATAVAQATVAAGSQESSAMAARWDRAAAEGTWKSSAPAASAPLGTQGRGSFTTGSAWLLAALPLLLLAVRSGYLLLHSADLATTAGILAIAAVPGGIISSVGLARRDARELNERGYPAPHPAWVLLAPPIVYLALRARRIRRAGFHSIGPVVLGSISFAVVGVILAVTLGTSVLGIASAADSGPRDGVATAGTVATKVDLAAYLEDWESTTFHRDVQVSCGSGDIVPGSFVQCSGTDASGTAVDFGVTIGPERQVAGIASSSAPVTAP